MLWTPIHPLQPSPLITPITFRRLLGIVVASTFCRIEGLLCRGIAVCPSGCEALVLSCLTKFKQWVMPSLITPDFYPVGLPYRYLFKFFPDQTCYLPLVFLYLYVGFVSILSDLREFRCEIFHLLEVMLHSIRISSTYKGQ